jgi:hypothetical protein
MFNEARPPWAEIPKDIFEVSPGGHYSVYTVDYREEFLGMLDKVGVAPTDEQLEGLVWPQRDWFEDQDRIMLLYHYILHENPPDGSIRWENAIACTAADLWDDGRGGFDSDGEPDLMAWSAFQDVAAPGWRMLTALVECPNHHMRMPVSIALKRKAGLGAFEAFPSPSKRNLPLTCIAHPAHRQAAGYSGPHDVGTQFPDSELDTATARERE